MVVAKVRERLPLSKRETLKFNMERFDPQEARLAGGWGTVYG